jgi:hypothetical protein
MAEELGRTLEQLTSTIQEQNKELKQKDSMKELDQSITALEKSGTENSARLRETLTQIQLSLDSATNEEQMDLAREQLDALQGLAGTEEENRENSRRQEEANEFLSKIVSGIDGLADAYDKQLDALKPSGGLLAGLGAVALLFTNPETLFAGVQAALDGIFAIVDSVKMFLEGDFKGGFEELKDNIAAVGAIIGTTALLFGGTIIRTIGSMVKAFSGLTKVIGKLFLPFTIITGLISFVTGFMKGYEDGGILGGIEAGLKSAFDTLVAWPLDLIKDGVAFVLGKLGFEDAKATLEAFSFSEQIDKIFTAIFDVVEKAVAWVKGLFTDPVATLTNLWNGIAAGFTSIANWIYDTALKPAFEWINGLFTWASEGLAEGWTNLTDYISGKWTAVKKWFTDLWTWASDGLAEGWTNLTDFVSGKWTATKKWFTDMFTWSSKEDDKGVIQQLFDSAIEKVTTFFTDLFDFLPSLDEVKEKFTSWLPDWMMGSDDPNKQLREDLEYQIKGLEETIGYAQQYNYEPPAGSELRLQELKEQLENLPGANKGGIVNAPASGTPVMLHGQEIIAPLDSPQGKVLMAINDLMNNKASAGAGEYGGMGGPMIVQGGSNQTSNNTNNVSNANYTIQQGITPDDFLKRDFLNFSY